MMSTYFAHKIDCDCFDISCRPTAHMYWCACGCTSVAISALPAIVKVAASSGDATARL